MSPWLSATPPGAFVAAQSSAFSSMRNLFIRNSIVLFPSLLLHLSIVGKCLSHYFNWFCNKGRAGSGRIFKNSMMQRIRRNFPTHYHRCLPSVWLLVPTFRNPRARVQVQVSPTVVHCYTCLPGSTQQWPIKKPSSCRAADNTNWGAHFQAIWAFLQPSDPVWKVKTYLEDGFFVFHVLNLRDKHIIDGDSSQ